MWDTVILSIFVFVLILIYRTGRRPKNMPPGPATWPIIGNLDVIYSSLRFHVKSLELGRKYNGMYSLQCAKHPVLIITDFNIAKEAFIEMSDIYSDRDTHLDYIKFVTPIQGVVRQSGETWKRLKRMTMMSFRDFGVGKSAIEHTIQTEADDIIAHVAKMEGQCFSFDNLFSKATTNVINAVVLDKRYSYDDPAFLKIINNMNNLFKETGFANISQFLPWWTFYFIPYVKPGLKTLVENREVLKQWIVHHVGEHRQTFDKDNLRDFIDLYLQAETTDENRFYTDKQLLQTIRDLFGAGAETTSTTLLWAIIYLVKNPDVQSNCRSEIRQKIGGRQVTYSARGDLPYLDATICEIQRCANTVPHTLAHRTNQQSTLRGYTVPKDTSVFVNTYAIHMDPDLWEDPYTFKPERFLDNEGKLIKHQAFLPFGLGKRACLGEMLAKMELWIFLAELLQKFEFQAENTTSLPTPENTRYALTLIPEPFYVKAIRLA